MLPRLSRIVLITIAACCAASSICAQGGDENVDPTRMTPEQYRQFKKVALERRPRLCWFYEGLRGEWISPLGSIVYEPCICVIRTPDGGLDVKRPRLLENIPLAMVSPEGDITYVPEHQRKEAILAPTKWPYKDPETGALIPPPKGVTLSLDSEAGTPPPEPPPGLVCWMFMTSDGYATIRHGHLKPFPNVLWVVREGKGLAILHSGPLEKGLYARVGEDFRITWLDPPHPQNKVRRTEADYWPFAEDETWLPTGGCHGFKVHPGIGGYQEGAVVIVRGGVDFKLTFSELEDKKRQGEAKP